MGGIWSRTLPLPLAFVLGAAAVPLTGQAQTNQKAPTFEIISVKANTSGDFRSPLQMGLPDGFTGTNQSLIALISIFYQVPRFRIAGAPGWITAERFDIAAKADRRISMDEKRAMVQALLEDRFKLRTHRESRESRLYALTLARADGKLGPNLTPSTLDCAAILAARNRGGDQTPPPGPGGTPPACMAFGNPSRFRANGIQLGSFALTLGTILQETIVDRTGLSGWFNLDLTMAQETAPGAPSDPVTAANATSIFTAVQEQLGLKLEPTKGPVDILVIDHVERPMPD